MKIYKITEASEYLGTHAASEGLRSGLRRCRWQEIHSIVLQTPRRSTFQCYESILQVF